MLQAGKFDRLITIEQRSASKNASGEDDYTWSTYASVWASKRDKSGTEYWESDQENAEVITEFIIRYNSGVKAEMRISYDSKVYDIVEILEIGRTEGMKIMAKAGIE